MAAAVGVVARSLADAEIRLLCLPRGRLILGHLAAERRCSASTQNQALNALVFLYRRVLNQELVRCDCLDADDAHDMCSWGHHGRFSLDASVHIDEHDRTGIERLARYCARHPFAKGRLQRAGQQTVVYQLHGARRSNHGPSACGAQAILQHRGHDGTPGH